MWIWLKGLGRDGSDQGGAVEPVSPAWYESSESEGVCPQMTLGTIGRWRKTQCAGRYLFLCEKLVTGKTH